MPLTDKQVNSIKAVIHSFVDNNDFHKSEDHVQTYYTNKVLEILGWDASTMVIHSAQEVKTGNIPDILLKRKDGGTIFVIESKKPSKDKGLDGKYQKWTFAEQTCSYISSEGVSFSYCIKEIIQFYLK